MGFLSHIFGGSSYNTPGWMRDQGRDIFNRFGDMYDDYNPQTEVATGMENFDRIGAGAQAARGIARRGFGGSVTPSMDLTRARFGANLWTQANKKQRDWRRQILGQQYGMLSGMQGLFGKTYRPGFAAVFGKGLGDTLTSIGSSGMSDPNAAKMGGGSSQGIKNPAVFQNYDPQDEEMALKYAEYMNGFGK